MYVPSCTVSLNDMFCPLITDAASLTHETTFGGMVVVVVVAVVVVVVVVVAIARLK